MTLHYPVMMLLSQEQQLIYTIYCERGSCYPEAWKCALETIIPREGAGVAPYFTKWVGLLVRGALGNEGRE